MGLVVVAHGFSCSAACGNLLKPRIEPLSPALAGRFLTTGPQGKSLFWCVCFVLFWGFCLVFLNVHVL